MAQPGIAPRRALNTPTNDLGATGVYAALRAASLLVNFRVGDSVWRALGPRRRHKALASPTRQRIMLLFAQGLCCCSGSGWARSPRTPTIHIVTVRE